MARLPLIGALAALATLPTAASGGDFVSFGGAATVRQAPSVRAARRGTLLPATPFEVTARRDGPGCDAAWGALADGGITLPSAWVCLDGASATDARPGPPPSLDFDFPSPREAAGYERTGSWPYDASEIVGLLPFAYGRRGSRWPGRIWASVDAFLSGAPPVDTLPAGRSVHFAAVENTARGLVLTLPDGRAVPSDEVLLNAPSRFVGVDGARVPDGRQVVWTRADGGVGDSLALPARTALLVDAARWGSTDATLDVMDLDGATLGALPRAALRGARPAPAPSERAGPWVDVDRQAQVLEVRAADGALLWTTLVSTGARGSPTPAGRFAVIDKILHWDMASRDGASNPYHVEEVPWVVHFAPRYALHGAFWHDAFGATRSHGCVNLAPRDAQAVFDRLGPALPWGWHAVWPAPGAPASVVRIR